ncbi:MAG: 23S rRNA pseudouridine synthase F [Tenericutes bacterium HGW-Tenericutes-8]|nr:MAG: 23S rRNA pseudouridine synthase F [Tenericutes bacterium HGW-Tenericutes-8]
MRLVIFMYAKKLQIEATNQVTLTHEKSRGISINKYLSDAGIASRRGAEVIIKANRVKIGDALAKLGDRVFDQTVTLDDEVVKPIENKLYLLLNKPVGIVCSTEKLPDNIVDYMNLDETIFPVGRLDKDSSGLILMTNDGDIVNKILRNEFGHEKEYIVTVNKPITKDFIDYMSNGVVIYNQKKNTYQQTEPCVVTQISEDTFKIILTQFAVY